MTSFKLFGREPALWSALISAIIMVVSSFVVPLSVDQQGCLNAIVTAGFGFLTAYFVAKDGTLPAALGLLKAVLALALSFGLQLSPEKQGMLMTLAAAIGAMFVRTQVTAPVSASGAKVPKMGFIVALLIPFLLFGNTACVNGKYLHFGSSADVVTGDPVVVNAEETTNAAKDALDGFLKAEYDNITFTRAKAPQVHAYAEFLRAHVPPSNFPRYKQWLTDARNMTKAYKNNRSAENKANLETALAVLTQAEKTVTNYLPMAQGGGH